ncbi:hypothetical protein ZEAMMB73_Zm00001d008179 [Zea mays]|uniref:Uncharacterized protein n=1 Tax=Zea mays TaxID=4577 RepID=A0A1D6FAR4_MAIZE|nr:hypothetical protein ZEAMMB73_Zm00001d008179 [Zea mays]
MDAGLASAVTMLRTCTDVVHLAHVLEQFRLAWCGKLVRDTRAVAPSRASASTSSSLGVETELSMYAGGNKGAIAGCNSNPPNPFPQKSKQLRHLDQTRRTMSTPLGTSTNFSPPNSIYLCPLCTGEGDRDPRNAARCSSSGQVLSGHPENWAPVIGWRPPALRSGGHNLAAPSTSTGTAPVGADACHRPRAVDGGNKNRKGHRRQSLPRSSFINEQKPWFGTSGEL